MASYYILSQPNSTSTQVDCGLMEYSLLAASPEDGYPPGLSLAEVPVVLGPMVPRDQTIVVSALNNTQHLLDIVTKPIKSHPEN